MLMLRSLTVTLAVLAFSLMPAGASAAGRTSQPKNLPVTVSTTFHLRVAGRLAPGTTLWVAYGPLRGKFGIIRLRAHAGNLYTATRVLPAAGKTVFSFIAGNGTMTTRLGVVPGNPVRTIRSIGPTSIWPHGVPTVLWRVPAAQG
jgi:hypothetical protein